MKLVFAGLFLGLLMPSYVWAEETIIKVALLSTSAQSTLYKWQDSDGRVHYSDQPPRGVTGYTALPSMPKGYAGYEVKTHASAPISSERYPFPPPAKPAVAPSTKMAQVKPDLTATLVWLDSRQR